MTTELLTNLWRINQLSAAGPIQKLTTETYRNRLTPDTASAGFIALHTAESMHGFAKILFGRAVVIETQTTKGVSDDGRPLDLALVQQMVNDAFALITDHIRQTTDEQWAEVSHDAPIRLYSPLRYSRDNPSGTTINVLSSSRSVNFLPKKEANCPKPCRQNQI